MYTDSSGMTASGAGNRGGYFYSPLVQFKSGDVDKPKEETGLDPWMFTIQDMRLIEEAMWDIARRYAEAYADATTPRKVYECLPPEIKSQVQKIGAKGIDPQTAFLLIHGGKITIYTMRSTPGWYGFVLSRNSMNIYYGGFTENEWEVDPVTLKPTNFYSWLVHWNRNTTRKVDAEFVKEAYKRFVVHEVGHMFDQAVYDKLGSHNWPRNAVGDDLITGQSVMYANGFYDSKKGGWQWRLDDQRNLNYEIFADQFIGWVYDSWERVPFSSELTDLGKSRKKFMDENMAYWITEMIGYETP